MNEGDYIKFNEGPYKGLVAKVVTKDDKMETYVVQFFTGQRQIMTGQLLKEWAIPS